MAPRYATERGGGGGSARSRILTAVSLGAIIGLALSIGSLQLSKIQREAAVAIEDARQQASKAVSRHLRAWCGAE